MPTLVYKKIGKRNRQTFAFTNLDCDIGGPIINIYNHYTDKIKVLNRYELEIFKVLVLESDYKEFWSSKIKK